MRKRRVEIDEGELEIYLAPEKRADAQAPEETVS